MTNRLLGCIFFVPTGHVEVVVKMQLVDYSKVENTIYETNEID